MINEVRRELYALADEKHAAFSRKLIETKADILGVKTPDLKRIAKRLAREDMSAYFSELSFDVYEETAIRALLISYGKLGLKERMALIEDFVPHIDNWGICDLFCSSLRPHIKKNQSEFWALIQKYLYSDKEFYIRFGLVVMLVGFVSPEYAEAAFRTLDCVDTGAYYAMMAAAWTLSEFYIKLPGLTLPYLENNRLDDITYNKALSKMLDSHRVSREDREMIRRMKRK